MGRLKHAASFHRMDKGSPFFSPPKRYRAKFSQLWEMAQAYRRDNNSNNNGLSRGRVLDPLEASALDGNMSSP